MFSHHASEAPFAANLVGWGPYKAPPNDSVTSVQEKQDRLIRGVEQLLAAAGLPSTTNTTNTFSSLPLGCAVLGPLPVGCAPANSGDGGGGYGGSWEQGSGGDGGNAGGMFRELIASKLAKIHPSGKKFSVPCGPEVPSRVSALDGVPVLKKLDSCNGVGCGDDTGGGDVGCGEQWRGQEFLEEIISIPFSLCKTPSFHQQQTMIKSPLKPVNVAGGAGPDLSSSVSPPITVSRSCCDTTDGRLGAADGRATIGRGSKANMNGADMDDARNWQRQGSNSNGVGKEVASDMHLQKSPGTFTEAAGPSAEVTVESPPPPPPLRPGQQTVSAMLGYLKPSPSPSPGMVPGPSQEATVESLSSSGQSAAPGRLPAWPGPYRNWLESRTSEAVEELSQQTQSHEGAAGPGAAATGGEGGAYVCSEGGRGKHLQTVAGV